MTRNTEDQNEETLDPNDWEFMKIFGHKLVDDTIDYVQKIRDRPVWQHAPLENKKHFTYSVPQVPTPANEIYQEFVNEILPYQLGNVHPRYWGWATGCGTVMSMFAELLSAGMDARSGAFSFISNNYVESQVINWFKECFGFPENASGILTSGCSTSNLIGLTVARNLKAGFNVREKGMHFAKKRMTIYCSEQAHFSLQKSIELLGFGNESLRKIPTTKSMTIDVEILHKEIENDRKNGFQPICVIGTAGTTNTGAIDDLNALANICKLEDCWFHVDGAYGAWTAITPQSKRLVSGIDKADSLAFDLHKWMSLSYPIGCVLIRNSGVHHRTFSLTPSYLKRDDEERGLTGRDIPWLIDFGFEQSRGFPALKAWMTIKEQGIAKIGRLIQKNIDQAGYLSRLIESSPQLELALPVTLNVVNFRYVIPNCDVDKLNAINRLIEIELQEQGIAVLSSIIINDKRFLHAAITNHRSSNADFDLLIQEINRIGNTLTGSGY